MHLSHCRCTRDRNRPFLQDRVLPLSRFKCLQTAYSSQRLPQPTYHRHNTVLSNVTPTIQLGEIVVHANFQSVGKKRP